MAARPTYRQSSSFSKRRRLRLILIAVLIIVSVISWIVTISRISRLNALGIDDVTIIGADPDIESSLRAAVLEAISGDYIGLLSKSNAVIYPRMGVTKAVEQASSRILSVGTRTKGIHTLVVSVKEKDPAELICPGFPDFSDGSLDTTAASHCYFADESGFIFRPATATSSTTPMPAERTYYMPDLGASPIGAYAASSTEVAELNAFYDKSEHAGLDVLSILFKGGGEYEMYARNPAGGDPIVVYFDRSRPISEELSNLISFWTYRMEAVRSNKKPLDFEYIKLQYGSNVIYR